MKPQYRTMSAGGIAGAIVVILAWGLSYLHVTLPQEVQSAVETLLVMGLAMVVHDQTDSAPAEPPAPPTSGAPQ